jgi:hypothetical protein
MAAGDSSPKKRSSKTPSSNSIFDVNEIKKLIEKAEAGLSSRSAVINAKNLKTYKKALESIESGTVNNSVTGRPNMADIAGPVTGPGLVPNVLHKFASYTTLFTLSGVNDRELHDHSFLFNPVHDVIARSGGTFDPNVGGNPASADATQSGDQDDTGSVAERVIEAERIQAQYGNAIGVLKDGRDIFFEELNLLSTVGPGEERGMADFVKMEFKLHEPFGVSFIEKMRAAARLNDYRDHMDAPMLLTIEFKGFDENGIPMDAEDTVRKIPILISKVELDVNEGGAIYDVTAVRINDIAFDDRFKFPRSEITINADTLEGAGEQLAKQLNEQVLREKDEHKVREVLDEYRIEFDDDVIQLSRGFIGGKDVRNTAVDRARFSKGDLANKVDIKVAEAQVSDLVSITKLLEDMVRTTTGYEDLASDFWTSYLKRTGGIKGREDASEDSIKKFYESEDFEEVVSKNSFVDWFKIKTSVQTDYDKFDDITKMHRKIVTYRVIPYKIHVLKFMRPGIFLAKGTARNDVKKQYNYIYTGDNTDVQSLRINYKAAYYQRNGIEVSTKDADGVFEKLDSVITRLFGKQDPDDNDITHLRNYPSIRRGRNTFNKADTDKGIKARSQDFYDYLINPTLDMMRIEMDILGDPAFICQDQYIPLDKQGQARKSGGIYDGTSGSFNADSHTPLMELIYRLPDDINDKTGVMFEGNTTVPEENLFFAGLYQIVRIESKITNGQFLQTLTCVRLNNQNGAGEPLFESRAQAGDKLLKSVGKNDNFGPSTFVEDKILDQIRQKATNKYINNKVLYDADGNVDGL